MAVLLPLTAGNHRSFLDITIKYRSIYFDPLPTCKLFWGSLDGLIIFSLLLFPLYSIVFFLPKKAYILNSKVEHFFCKKIPSNNF